MYGMCLRHGNLLFVFDTRKNEEYPIIGVFTVDYSNEWSMEVVVDTSFDLDPNINIDLLVKIKTAMSNLATSVHEEGDLLQYPPAYEIHTRRNFQLMTMA